MQICKYVKYTRNVFFFQHTPEQDEGVRRHRDGTPPVPGGPAHGRIRGVLPAEPAAPGVVQLGAQLSRRVRVHVRVCHDDSSALHQLQGESLLN